MAYGKIPAVVTPEFKGIMKPAMMHLSLLKTMYRLCQKKILQFSIFYCGSIKPSTAKTLHWSKVCKEIFGWYCLMVRCNLWASIFFFFLH